MQKPPPGIATFDSASAMARALAQFLHGRDFPALGQPWYAERLAPLPNILPRRLRQMVFSTGGLVEAVPPDKVGQISTSAIAEWITNLYPRRRFPAAMIGSSNGALIHLCAALAIPWLPQTFLTLVRQGHPDLDDARASMARGHDVAHVLLGANPGVMVHHMHDPNQDRRMLRHVSYFRTKYSRLPASYRRFLIDHLEPGATIYVADCRQRWPLTRLTDRYSFQFGAVGGASPRDYFEGGRGVARYFADLGQARRRWDPPVPDIEGPEAEWGYEPALDDDLAILAAECGFRIVHVVFDDPEDPSPLVADLYRGWHAERGIAPNRLLIPSFILIEPYWTLRTGMVPLWMVFNVEPSIPKIQRYLARAGPFDEIRMMLFSNATDALGLASTEAWRSILDQARDIGAFVGVDETAYPSDFAAFARYHTALKAIRPHFPLPAPLELSRFEALVRQTGHQYGVSLTPADFISHARLS